jgi:amino acid transporter
MSAHHDVDLKRQLGLFAAISITVGNIVGSGIFRSPHSVAQQMDSLGLVLLAWVVGGVLSLCGSLVLAELAVTHPKTGGLYVFIREAFGDAWAFVFGWANLWVIKPTVIASIVSVFALYFCEAVGLAAPLQLWVGMAAILLLTWVNWLGVKEGARTQELFTTAKMVGIFALIVAAFALPHAGPASEAVAAMPETHPTMFVAFALAMIPVLFAYDGWTDSTYVGGEIRDPGRTLPIAIIGGTVVVIATYVLVNLAYYRVLLPAEVAQYEAVGSETIGRILGDGGRTALAVLVAVSTFGTTNGAILTGPRVTLAMAANGLLWQPLARVDTVKSSPGPALWLQAALACAWLAFAGGFEDVSGWFVTTSWLFYGLTTAAVFVLRRREGAPATYRTPLYPLTPVLFILVTVALIASDLSDQGWRAAAGVIVAALGFPVYYIWKGRRRAA